MRFACRFLLLLVCAVPAVAAEGISFVRVWPGWRDADAFDSISEYFTGREEHGHRTVLRTTPDARAGFYFLVRVKNAVAPVANARFVLEVVEPAGPEPRTYLFRASVPTGTSVFQLGLTGPQWPDARTHPVAWKLALQGDDDRPLTTEQSFLWAKPSR